jgi:hypothetical protein
MTELLRLPALLRYRALSWLHSHVNTPFTAIPRSLFPCCAHCFDHRGVGTAVWGSIGSIGSIHVPCESGSAPSNPLPPHNRSLLQSSERSSVQEE